MFWNAILNAGLDILYPPHCIACDKSTRVLSGAMLCEACAGQLRHERFSPACRRCGAGTGIHGRDSCPQCVRRKPRFDGIVRVAPDGGLLGDMLRAYKFDGQVILEPLLVRLLAFELLGAGWLSRIDCVTWVPAHWSRRWLRRVYPAERLGRSVAAILGSKRRAMLRRTRRGRHQVGLSWHARRRNVRGVFDLRRSRGLRGMSVLLIDDVATTGSTLSACARTLKRAGVESVYAAVLLKVDSVTGGAQPGR